MDKNVKSIVSRLFEEINVSGMTLTSIAKKIGITQPTLSQYKNSGYLPSLLTFQKICKVIGANANYILGLDDFK